jgi:trehalose 6-phosphate phosphatase
MSSPSQVPGREGRCKPAASAVPLTHAALFLDVDGNLLEIAARPDEVIVEPALVDLLRRLSLRCSGAIALVSGRSIAVLDELFGQLLLPAAGLHGFERRNANGMYCRHALPAGEVLSGVRCALARIAARDPCLVLEDKRFSLALHYRQAPHLEDAIIAEVLPVAASAASDLELQRGKMVIELRPRSANKATAVAEFMGEAPFAGRMPVYMGDDLTDEPAFEWVNVRGGLSIAVDVSRETAAATHLDSVSEARGWLRSLLMQPARSLKGQ